MGRARIDGRPVIVLGDDFTVRGGSADATIAMKPMLAERMANELRLPIIRIIEGSGGGGSVKTIETIGARQPAGPARHLPVRLPVSRRQPGHRAGGGAGARLGGGARRGAAGGQPLLGHDQVHLGHVRGRAAGGGAHRPGPRQAGARRLGGAVPGRRRRPRGRDGGGGVRMRAPLPVLPAVLGLQRAGARASASIRPTGARRCCSRSSRATAARSTRCGRSSRRWSTRARSSRWARCSAAPIITGPGAARRAAGGDPGERPLPLRRRLDGGRLRQDRALRRPGRDLPSAGRLSVRLPGLPDRAGGGEIGDHPPRRARHGRHQPVERAVVHGDRAQLVRRGRRRARAGRAAGDPLCLAVGAGGARCRSRAASRRPIAPRSTRRPTPRPSSPRSRRGSTRCARRSAPPRRSGSRRSSIPRDTRKLLCEFANLAEPLRTPGPRAFSMRP